jgi:hypothetical protein
MVAKFSEGDGSDGCLSRLSDSQKKKLVGIIIDHMDMQNIVGASKESKDVTSDPEFLNDIMNDEELGSGVLNCYDQEKNTEDDDQDTNTEDDGQDTDTEDDGQDTNTEDDGQDTNTEDDGQDTNTEDDGQDQ